MNKIPIIIAREYITRVRKKSFIIMSVLGPILFAALMILPAWLSQIEQTEVKRIAVVDSSHLFRNVIPETEFLKFDYLENVSINALKDNYASLGYYGILYISHIVTYDPNSVIIYSAKQPNLATKMHISNHLENYIRDQKLKTYNIENLDDILKSVKTTINVRTIKITEEGEEKESSTGIMMAVGYVSGFLMYMFLIFCGTMVMRGVVEEKTSRIVEVIISSVKPFQLMFGKIVGIALVGLTQLLIWIISTFILVSIAQAIFFPEFTMTPTEQVVSQDIMSASPAGENQSGGTEEMEQLRSALSTLKNIDFVVIILTFLFYFLGGYFLYASMFAAVGAAVDNETDTQQFVFPILLPLILGIIVLFSITNNPDSPLAYWCSIIPFTSPIVMMARIPFGVPWADFFLSAGLLIAFFLGATWLAGKIYRTGILMYGKKPTFKEMLKWVRYKT
ncbi:MAG: ABC transporter permease [Candidatus Cloacimonetes bacterium]|nr:ABC transporter permease [Candidatus Cloacimonadota bacterium]